MHVITCDCSFSRDQDMGGGEQHSSACICPGLPRIANKDQGITFSLFTLARKQAMTQVRKQTSFCLFARPARPSLNKIVRGYLGHKSIQTRTKLKKKNFVLKEKWVRPLEQLDRMDKHVSSSHCSLLRQPLQSPGPKPPHFILKKISRHLAHSRLTKISSCYSRFILVL